MGDVYRELEKQGKVPVENIERKAELKESKAAKAQAMSRSSRIWAKIKVTFAEFI